VIAVWLAFLIELWAVDVDGHQHRTAFDAQIRVAVFEAGITLSWWGRPDALIAHSPINLEANGWLERQHWVRVSVPVGRCGVGAIFHRRGVEQIGVQRKWRETIGYHDGLRFTGQCYGVEVWSPYVYRPNDPLTLPWHDWRVETMQRVGRWVGSGFVGLGGPRDGASWDVGIGYDFGPIVVGGRIGAVESPGWGESLFRWGIAANIN
jgi:hypothetical protein